MKEKYYFDDKKNFAYVEYVRDIRSKAFSIFLPL